MKNIAPDIFRQRLILEGFYTVGVTKNVIENYLLDIANYLGLKT
jgi:S-adenosylmethionine decarboxylase